MNKTKYFWLTALSDIAPYDVVKLLDKLNEQKAFKDENIKIVVAQNLKPLGKEELIIHLEETLERLKK